MTDLIFSVESAIHNALAARGFHDLTRDEERDCAIAAIKAMFFVMQPVFDDSTWHTGDLIPNFAEIWDRVSK